MAKRKSSIQSLNIPLQTFEFNGDLTKEQIADLVRQGYEVEIDGKVYTSDGDNQLEGVTIYGKAPKENPVKKAINPNSLVQTYMQNYINQWLQSMNSPVAGHYSGGGKAKKVYDNKTNQILLIDPNNLQVFNVKGEQLDWQDFEDRDWAKQPSRKASGLINKQRTN